MNSVVYHRPCAGRNGVKNDEGKDLAAKCCH
jgi:hypothetical protein